MTYSNDPKWRQFMDAKWKEMEQNRMKPSTSDMLIHSSPNYILEHLKKKEEAPATKRKHRSAKQQLISIGHRGKKADATSNEDGSSGAAEF